ncbi:nucleoid-associated protein [Nocardioides psychrotolerans]|uniref:nucleoid-associated protein n=1 Tax=Nocardioides psychrotolerans TaxID=1005945 RepID=UPI003137D8F8
MAEVGDIRLGDTMVHEIPRGSKTTNPDLPVILSNDLTPLDADTDRFIRDQMLAPFIPTGRDIIALPDGGDDSGLEFELVPRLVKELLGDTALLPGHSRVIAEHMFDSQRGAASAGIFVASVGTCSGGPCVIVMKAEHQEGVRMRHHGQPGQVSFDVEHISELIVGKNSRVYKIAMLWVRGFDGAVIGKMVDKQNGVGYADYFLHRFLGMQLMFDAEKLTKDLLESATRHINAHVDPEKKTRYTRALVALMESPEDKLSGMQFITRFIDAEDRDDFEAALPAETLREFSKDVTLVKSRIGGLVFDLQDGAVQVKATSEAVANGDVEVDATHKRVVIKGVPDNISPSGPPKR